MSNCRLLLPNKQKQDGAHKQAGYEDADRNEHTQFRKSHRAAQHQR